MPTRPTEDTDQLLWATDTNYSGGLDGGTPTKSEPATGRKDQGWRGNLDGDKPPAQEWNWWMHFNAEWIEWLEAVLTVGHDDNGDHRANVIDTLQLVDSAVETAKINDNAITNDKMADDSVDTAEIVTEAVGRDEIWEQSNLIWNPTARKGNASYYDGGSSTQYDNPGTDTDQYNPANPPNFTAQPWTSAFGSGPQWTIFSAGGIFKADLSERIPIGPGVELTLSAMITLQGLTAGSVGLDIICYDSSGNFLGIIAPIVLTSSTIRKMFEATGTTIATTPADTAYIRWRRWHDVSAAMTNYIIHRVQIGDVDRADAFDDAMTGQYLSARYSTDTAQNLPGLSTTIINFDDKVFDDPGTDRVTTGAAWKFTADRYMKIRVSICVSFDWFAAGGPFNFLLYYTPKGGAAAAYSKLKRFVAPAGAPQESVNGTDIIELNEGDAIDVRFANPLAGAATLSGDDIENYIAIEEIN